MTILKVLELLESENELRNTLGLERATMRFYIDDVEADDVIRDNMDYLKYVRDIHKVDFIKLLEKADFKKTYGNTLTAYIKYQPYKTEHTYKIDLFVDC